MVSPDPASTCVAPLFVPGDRPERFAKAAASGAAAIIIDLEDAVARTAKDAARRNLPDGSIDGVPVLVRVNARSTPWHPEDLEQSARLRLDGIVLPKVESPADVHSVLEATGGRMPIVALIETARGVAAARAIAGAGVARLAFGSIDFCADLGCAHTREALLPARGELVLASRLADLPAPLDGVTAQVHDAAQAESDARHAAELGFSGKLCIHPRQIEPVFRGFAPTDAELDWAAKVLAATRDGAVAVDGMMIDAPVRRRAERLAAWSRRQGRRA